MDVMANKDDDREDTDFSFSLPTSCIAAATGAIDTGSMTVVVAATATGFGTMAAGLGAMGRNLSRTSMIVPIWPDTKRHPPFLSITDHQQQYMNSTTVSKTSRIPHISKQMSMHT
jgi:hypothetical protein